jgi:Xaa-Pro aminopeptidase
MAVHDVGEYRDRPLEVGAVFSVDPMIWIPEESLYVRCEDTVVITSDGCENFTASAPLDCDQIEMAMATDGILDLWDPETAEAIGGVVP